MNIVEYVEKVCNFKLTDFQKEFVKKVYDAAVNHKQLYYVPPRGSNRFTYELLQSITIIYIADQKGMINMWKGEQHEQYNQN